MRTSRFHVQRLRGVACVALLLVGEPAWATYSLIASDSANGELGGFVISCVGPDFDLSEVVRLNDRHVVAAQGYLFTAGRDELFFELTQGASIEEAFAAALDPSVDPPGVASGPTYRQYAAVALSGSVVQHSGSDLSDFAGHKSGSVETFTYALQGNILTDGVVLDRLEGGFLQPGTTIAERSVSALRALAAAGGGDSRCAPLSGDAGYFVTRKVGGSSLEVQVGSLPPGEEVAGVLAGEIESEVGEFAEGESPGEPGAPSGDPNNSEDSNGTSPTDAPSGCSHTYNKGQGGAFGALLVALVFGARRRLGTLRLGTSRLRTQLL